MTRQFLQFKMQARVCSKVLALHGYFATQAGALFVRFAIQFLGTRFFFKYVRDGRRIKMNVHRIFLLAAFTVGFFCIATLAGCRGGEQAAVL